MGSDYDLKNGGGDPIRTVTHEDALEELNGTREKLASELEGNDKTIALAIVDAAIGFSNAIAECVERNEGGQISPDNTHRIIGATFGDLALRAQDALDRIIMREELLNLMDALGSPESLLEAIFGGEDFPAPEETV